MAERNIGLPIFTAGHAISDGRESLQTSQPVFFQSKSELFKDLVGSSPIELFHDLRGIQRDFWKAAHEYRDLLIDPIYDGRGVPKGDGSTVVVMGGFGSIGINYYETVRTLRKIGYNAVTPPWGVNIKPINEMAKSLMPFVRSEKIKSGKKVKFIGHSLGGFDGAAMFAQAPDEFVDYVDHVVFDASPRPTSVNKAIAFAYLVTQWFESDNEFDIVKKIDLLNKMEAAKQLKVTSVDSSSDPIIKGQFMGKREHFVIEGASHTALGLNANFLKAVAYSFAGEEMDLEKFPNIKKITLVEKNKSSIAKLEQSTVPQYIYTH